MEFALNHSVAPGRRFAEFAGIARAAGVTVVELRNDLPGVELADGTPPETIRRQAEDAGARIASINALQRFDAWDSTRAQEAAWLARAARACGAAALVLCPVNDPKDRRNEAERGAGLRSALKALAPILAEHGLIGFIEPLGFAQSALRTKRDAVAAIEAAGGGLFALVHDTFHHFLAGEAEFFPERTGLVHVSGVEDRGLAAHQLTDAHRVLVGDQDVLGTMEQLRKLLRGGYDGVISLEPFAAHLRTAPDLVGELRASFALLRAGTLT
jgi:2-keto-myo-inositol isomerase